MKQLQDTEAALQAELESEMLSELEEDEKEELHNHTEQHEQLKGRIIRCAQTRADVREKLNILIPIIDCMMLTCYFRSFITRWKNT